MIANSKNGLRFLVRSDALDVSRLVPTPPTAQVELSPGQALLEIDSFALTANNVTYAAHGDALGYWRFFPSGHEGWGLIPVWGFATVARSEHPELQVGERFYGLFPSASQVVMSPGHVRDEGFRDVSAHRKTLHPLYNQYTRTTRDPLYDAAHEGELLRPSNELAHGLALVGCLLACEVFGQVGERTGVADGDRRLRVPVFCRHVEGAVDLLVVDAAHGSCDEAELVRLQGKRLPRGAGVERRRAQRRTRLGLTLACEDEDPAARATRPALVLLLEQLARLDECRAGSR